MLSITLLFLSFFISLILLVIGIFGRSPTFIGMAGFIIIITGVAMGVYGVTEFDGSYNSTYSYHNASNISINGITRVENYVVHKTDQAFQAIEWTLVLVGLATLIYAVMDYTSPRYVKDVP